MGWISKSQQERDHNGQRNRCAACGHEGKRTDPLTKDDSGSRVHTSHTTDPRSGLYGRQQK